MCFSLVRHKIQTLTLTFNKAFWYTFDIGAYAFSDDTGRFKTIYQLNNSYFEIK